MSAEARPDLLSMTPDALRAALAAHFAGRGQPGYRTGQVTRALHERIAFLAIAPAATGSAWFAHRSPFILLHFAPMNLSEHQKKFLRGLGHQLKPMIMVGDAGLSESLVAEFESTLDHHELIKVRVPALDKAGKKELIASICQQTDAQLIQTIGFVVVLFRANPKNQRFARLLK